MRDFSNDHRWLSINTATIRRAHGAEQPLTALLDACARHGVRAVSPWRDQVAAAGLKAIAAQLRSLNLELSGYCRGGMFPAADKAGRVAVRDDNRRAVDEACELNAPCLVLVVGGLPGALAGKAAHKDIALARTQVQDGIAELLDYARSARAGGLALSIEPLHPMYAADRACINTLEQALDLCDTLDPSNTPCAQDSSAALNTSSPPTDTAGTHQPLAALGVAVDVYHVWWDPKLQQQIERAGRSRLHAFHVCDWLTPTTDLLNDRGMMGDGVIDIPKLRSWVEQQGFSGYSEVEIFSANNWWQCSTDDILRACIARHCQVV
jgi:sugar phosphate isomerase/epimerase